MWQLFELATTSKFIKEYIYSAETIAGNTVHYIQGYKKSYLYDNTVAKICSIHLCTGKIMQVCSVVILSCVLVLQAKGHQRVPPGVNPGQYQQNSPPPLQQQRQFPGGQQQFQGQVPQQKQFQEQLSPQQQQFQEQVPQQQFQEQPPPQQQQFQEQPPPQQQQFQGQPPPQQQQFQEQSPQQQQFQGQVPQQQFTQPPTQQQRFQEQPPPQQTHQVLYKDVTKEKEHMAEHMDVPIDTNNMSEQELQFHYFKMHDADGDNKIDGCELVKLFIHWHDHSNHEKEGGQPLPKKKIYKDDELVNMIDPVLASEDKNLDGFIDYPEYILARQAATARSQYAQYQKSL